MREEVVLKGDRDGLFLMVGPGVPFADILVVLEEKLETSSEFFLNTPEPPQVRYKGEYKLSREENAQLCALLDRYGLLYDNAFDDNAVYGEGSSAPAGDAAEDAADLPGFKDNAWYVEAAVAGEEPAAEFAADTSDEQPLPATGQAEEVPAEQGETDGAVADRDLTGDEPSGALSPDATDEGTPEQPLLPAEPEAAPSEPKTENLGGEEPAEFVFLLQRPADQPYGSTVRPALTVYRTLRGGQEIRYDGTIVIFGDVNPTARVIAQNDIFVAGVTRGVLHAGCQGDETACAAAGGFDGGQIRIAGLIVRAPDHLAAPVGFGVARINNGKIEVQTIRR